MKFYRNIALAAALAAGMALPALAQTADAPAPKTETTAPLPEAGVKKATPAPVKHTHHTTLKSKTAKPAPAKKTK